MLLLCDVTSQIKQKQSNNKRNRECCCNVLWNAIKGHSDPSVY